MVWSTIWRIVWVPIACLISGLFAGFILFTLGMERVTVAMHNERGDFQTLEALIGLLDGGLLLASGLTLIPAIAIVIIGEVARIRSSVYYIVGGGLALVAIPMLARFDQFSTFTLPDTAVWQVFATAGFAGGLAYWLLAGKRA
jgi:hypothetical protein